MEATAGFGEVDEETDADFASVLAPKSRAPRGERQRRKPAQRAQKAPESAEEPPTGAGTRPEPPAGAQNGSEERPRPARAAASSAPASAGRRGRRPANPSESSGKLVLWSPTTIGERLRQARSQTERLYRDQVLDALEATVDELPELIAAAHAPKTVQGRLFERVEASKPAAEQVPRKQLTIPGFTKTQLQVIDDLVESTGAGSRSELVNTALEHYLPAS